ncbi:hypothetical protein [Bdellovibrio sp. HCB-162]|uniref:hypothetical protein n=1 Tax=Bdellovibrio sp. HCB-162 TaxID=3394234 RepID=UPI0039BCE223
MESVRSGSHNFIHVFLGRGHNGAQKIVLCAPFQTDFDEVECILSLSGVALPPMKAKVQDPQVRNFVFEFHGLIPGGKYTYRFTKKGETLNLGAGLVESDLRFTYWSTLDAGAETVLMSCNGVYIFKDQNKKWDMWRRLETTVANSKNPPKLLILGGDQYYQDDTEKEFYEKLKGDVTPELRNEVKMAAIRRAWEQTSDPSYRRLMAQIPSIAMCDDHDFTDGAGGRFCDIHGNFEPAWLIYRDILVEVFEAFQASRNPEPLIKKTKSAYSFSLDLGDSALVALDMRTEKNSRKSLLMEDDHKNEVLKAIRSLKHKNIMLLLPVVPLRNSREIESLLLLMSMIFESKDVENFLKGISPKIKEGADYVAGLKDDLEDALTSPPSLPFFTELLDAISEQALNGVQFTILSGDIHTGGSVEMKVTKNGKTFAVPILVSSPIGYNPMPKLVEGALKESSSILINSGNLQIAAVANQFYPKRNFVFLKPGLLNTTEKSRAARIFVEGVSGYRYMPIDLWNELEPEFNSVSVVPIAKFEPTPQIDLA